LPQALVTRLNAEFNRITDLPEMRKKFDEQGISAWPARSPQEALKFLHQDTDFWLPIIKASGATAG
jgi:tripartite-type tricarboxylate transporter receptor subunit TctC